MNKQRRITLVTAALAALALLPACEQKRTSIEDADAREMVELLMPEQIKIVEAFTSFRSFDDDDIPDGVELLLQPVDSFGDPVKIAGTLLVEVYSFNQAAGNRAGERLCEPWQIPLLTEDDQHRYWNIVTEMYEIPLEFPAGLTGAGAKYVLQVTYNTPISTHMTDECVLEAPTPAG